MDAALEKFYADMARHEQRKIETIETGVAALARLVDIAKRDTGQAMTVRALLLGLYNGHRFPFNLTRLRGLDIDLYDDCIAVINLDARATVREIHQYIYNGGRLFESWAETTNEEA